MINKQDIVKIYFSIPEAKEILNVSKTICFNGKSNIFQDKDKRKEEGLKNQFAGQLGEASLFKYFFRKDGMKFYQSVREVKNQNLYVGDNGSDIPNCNIDIKCSHWKYKTSPLTYHLWIREREYHENWMYVLALTKKIEKQYCVYLLGWSKSEYLKKKTMIGMR
jgi:hypothetical protein